MITSNNHKKPSINIIGCGKLGKTIAKLLSINELAMIGGILNSSAASTQEAVRVVGAGTPCLSIQDLPEADITLIATRDDAVSDIAEALVQQGKIASGSIVFHCSGSLTADVLSTARVKGAYLASLHPIKSFANPDQAVATFAGTYCAIEGDGTAVSQLTTLFQALSATVISIDPAQKSIYHAGGVMANNYLVTLHHHATSCYTNAGIDETTAKHIVSMLMKDALNNLDNLNHSNALTGPLQRGDVKTVSKHIDALSLVEDLKQTKELYLSLGKKTIALTHHTDDNKQALINHLAMQGGDL